LAGLALIIGVGILVSGNGIHEARANEESSKGIETWLIEIEGVLTDSNTDSSGLLTGLPGLIATAQENDERQAVLQAHIEVITARARAGRSWPDPELRLGYEEEDGRDQIQRRAALRFRLPDRVDRRLLEKISAVDIDWMNKRLILLKEEIALRVKTHYAEGVFARMRLLSGSERLREVLQQERQLRILKDSGQASAIEEARLVVEELKLYRSLRSEFSEFVNAINELVGMGINETQAKGAFQNAQWDQLLVNPFPSLEELVTIAVRNSEDTLQFEREDGMLSIRLNEVKRSWLPSPSFFQLEWGDRKDFGETGRDNEWGALAGFTVDLFDDHAEELLLSIRRETELNHNLDLKTLEQDVKSGFADISSLFSSYEQFLAICEPATESIERMFEESSAAGENESALWPIQEDLYDLKSELLDMRWMLVETLMEFESTIGQVISNRE